eukprot:g4095.t1
MNPAGNNMEMRNASFFMAVAKHDYEAVEEDELSLVCGSSVLVRTTDNSQWWYGSCNGAEGFFPSSYVTTNGDHQRSKSASAHDDRKSRASAPPMRKHLSSKTEAHLKAFSGQNDVPSAAETEMQEASVKPSRASHHIRSVTQTRPSAIHAVGNTSELSKMIMLGETAKRIMERLQKEPDYCDAWLKKHDETMAAAKRGARFQKHKHQRSKERFIQVCPTVKGYVLAWAKTEKLSRSGNWQGSVSFFEIRDVVPGKSATEHFSRKVQDSLCFSIVGRDRTIDLEAPSEEQRDRWVKVFQDFIVSSLVSEKFIRTLKRARNGGGAVRQSALANAKPAPEVPEKSDEVFSELWQGQGRSNIGSWLENEEPRVIGAPPPFPSPSREESAVADASQKMDKKKILSDRQKAALAARRRRSSMSRTSSSSLGNILE